MVLVVVSGKVVEALAYVEVLVGMDVVAVVVSSAPHPMVAHDGDTRACFSREHKSRSLVVVEHVPLLL